ncbi:MAG: glutamate--tRNA ligase [Pseudobdellovibrionaceae bacterium]|nr:glutamate--tRNA ligase [Pseudobdellovibrionaceae bacterium]
MRKIIPECPNFAYIIENPAKATTFNLLLYKYPLEVFREIEYQSLMTVITRFPPSPTGFMHIGTARTGLFNWLYARRHGGKMLFRIEDTDRSRHSEEAVQAIINGLNWMGIDWDGDVVSQFARSDRHAEVAHELVKSGKAYYCYCSPEELEQMREEAKKEGRPTFYDRRWRDNPPSSPPEGVTPVVRIKAPMSGERVVHDKVQGDVRVAAEQLDDFIILRADGTPTYMLAVVVDDHDMGVTHVIRGDDHLNNTFRQNVIYEAMGWDIPSYAHLPLILGPDGAKLSKRHGATSVEEYRDMGYLPEAMRNYLLRLGWSHGDDEIIETDQAIKWFDLEHINQGAARFDFDKLNFVNAHYMKLADNNRLADLTTDIYKLRGIEVTDLGSKRLLARMDELKSRAKTLVQLADDAEFLIRDIPYEFEEKAAAQLNEDGKFIIRVIHDNLSGLSAFTADELESLCKSTADYHREGKLGKVMMPLRAAITGKASSPSLVHAMEVLGVEEVSKRIEYALSKF